MNNDEPAWKVTYQALDHSALLALLRVLQNEVGRAKHALEDIERLAGRSTEDTEKMLEKAEQLKKLGADHETLNEIQNELQRQLPNEANRKRASEGMLEWLVDLEKRRSWIRDVECHRRGLLPSPDDFQQAPSLGHRQA